MILRIVYHGLLIPLALALAWLAAWGRPKLRESFRARRGVWSRLRQGATRRDPKRPLAWFHVASAGELLQAEPLLRRFRERGFQLALTVASVSGAAWLRRVSDWPEVVWADLLPWDTWGAAGRLHDALRPALLVYVQADLWPGLVWAARSRGVPQALAAARLAPDSAKLRSPLGRALARRFYGRLDLILAGTEAARARLATLLPPERAHQARLRVGGDPGIETVLLRVREAQPGALPPGFRGGPVLVAGSTWPADEERLFPALRAAMAGLPELRAVICPHEPTEARLAALEAAWRPEGARRLSAWEAGGADAPGKSRPRVLLVDVMGRLAGLYRAGTVAYVGGAFSTGVHNVAEPAAAGLPTLFGPRHANSPAAQDLLAAGCAFSVDKAAALEAALAPLLRDRTRCAELGRRARARIEAQAGAAQATFDALLTLLERPRGAP